MLCVTCHLGETTPGSTTVTLERNGVVLIFRAVPARVCGNCGEAYVDEDTTRYLLAEAKQALRTGVQVDIREYRAA